MTKDRISIIPNFYYGRPAMIGIRITVQTILEFIVTGDSIDEVLKKYPNQRYLINWKMILSN